MTSFPLCCRAASTASGFCQVGSARNNRASQCNPAASAGLFLYRAARSVCARLPSGGGARTAGHHKQKADIVGFFKNINKSLDKRGRMCYMNPSGFPQLYKTLILYNCFAVKKPPLPALRLCLRCVQRACAILSDSLLSPSSYHNRQNSSTLTKQFSNFCRYQQEISAAQRLFGILPCQPVSQCINFSYAGLLML